MYHRISWRKVHYGIEELFIFTNVAVRGAQERLGVENDRMGIDRGVISSGGN